MKPPPQFSLVVAPRHNLAAAPRRRDELADTRPRQAGVVDVEFSVVEEPPAPEETPQDRVDAYKRKKAALPANIRALHDQFEDLQYHAIGEVKQQLEDNDPEMAYAKAIACAQQFNVLLNRLKKCSAKGGR